VQGTCAPRVGDDTCTQTPEQELAMKTKKPAACRTGLVLVWLAGGVLRPAPGAAAGAPPDVHPEANASCHRVEEIARLLQAGNWEAAVVAARAAIAGEIEGRQNPFATQVAQLAVAEAGQGRDEDALWHWQVALAMGWRGDISMYGAPGQRLERSPRRRAGEAPAGLVVRRQGDGAGPLLPARKLGGNEVTLPGGYRRFPRGIVVELIVDAEGRVRQPVVLASTFSALTYAVLDTLRDWRFSPAQSAGEPVASFYELRLPEVRPLEQVVDFGHGPLAKPLELLKAGHYRQAGTHLDRLWRSALDDVEQNHAYLGVAMALRALAAAGLGHQDQAICRFQAAQTLEPRLLGAELSAFGAPGALLMGHPWKAPQAECGRGLEPGPAGVPCCDHVTRPVPVSQRAPTFPEYARFDPGLRGRWVVVVIASVLDERGVLRDVVLEKSAPSANLDASALDAICDWRFQPATLEGRPVKVIYTLAVNFHPGPGGR
jgi:TonB family protein